jgi:hypothetical protein
MQRLNQQMSQKTGATARGAAYVCALRLVLRRP